MKFQKYLLFIFIIYRLPIQCMLPNPKIIRSLQTRVQRPMTSMLTDFYNEDFLHYSADHNTPYTSTPPSIDTHAYNIQSAQNKQNSLPVTPAAPINIRIQIPSDKQPDTQNPDPDTENHDPAEDKSPFDPTTLIGAGAISSVIGAILINWLTNEAFHKVTEHRAENYAPLNELISEINKSSDKDKLYSEFQNIGFLDNFDWSLTDLGLLKDDIAEYMNSENDQLLNIYNFSYTQEVIEKLTKITCIRDLLQILKEELLIKKIILKDTENGAIINANELNIIQDMYKTVKILHYMIHEGQHLGFILIPSTAKKINKLEKSLETILINLQKILPTIYSSSDEL